MRIVLIVVATARVFLCLSSLRSNYLKALQVAVSAPTGAKDQSSRDQAATSVANVINVREKTNSRQGGGCTERGKHCSRLDG